MHILSTNSARSKSIGERRYLHNLSCHKNVYLSINLKNEFNEFENISGTQY